MLSEPYILRFQTNENISFSVCQRSKVSTNENEVCVKTTYRTLSRNALNIFFCWPDLLAALGEDLKDESSKTFEHCLYSGSGPIKPQYNEQRIVC